MEQDIFRDKNFNDYPWFIPTKEFTYHGVNRPNQVFVATRSQAMDSPKMVLRKGDILKYPSAYKIPSNQLWKEWFIKKKDWPKHLPKKRWIPRFAHNQYAIVVNRYSIHRKKYRDFKDYGTTIMMITGPQILRIINIWNAYPFEKVVSKFPHKKRDNYRFGYIKLPFKKIEGEIFLDNYNISFLLEQCHKNYGEGEEARNLFLINLYEKLKEIGNDKRKIV